MPERQTAGTFSCKWCATET